MPKPTKLHNIGKPSSIQKQCKTDADSFDLEDPEKAVRQFQLELCWCIQQLEQGLINKKGHEKQKQQSWKVLQVLKSNTQPVIRKRQLMRQTFGDYRAKMQEQEKKLLKMTSKIKISEKPVNQKATFLRKSVFQTTGDSSFRFDFNLVPEEMNNGNPKTSNTTDCGISGDTSSNTEVTTVTENTISQEKTEKPLAESGDNKTIPFKFKFSESEFKFNFDVSAAAVDKP